LAVWWNVRDKLSRGNTSRHLLSRDQSNSTFHSKCSTSAKATAALCVSVEQLKFLPVKPNSFSCSCGQVVLKSQRATDKLVAECYERYFVCKVGNKDQVWVSAICCTSCSRAWYMMDKEKLYPSSVKVRIPCTGTFFMNGHWIL